MTLSGATNGATISDAAAIATITSDDPQPASTRIFEEDFAGFTAGGFAPNPTATQIDSDIWRVVGLSDIANPAYGFTATTGDFARGTIGSNDPTTAGVYSPTSNPALILQPTGAELDINGFIEARIENNSGSTATGFDIAFDWSYRNSGGRASSLQLSYSTDGTTFIAVPAAAFTTPADAVPLTGVFALQPEAVSLTGLAVAAGEFIYLRWTHASSAGSGNRDEVGIDNLTVDATGGATGPLVSVSDVSVNEAAGTMTFTVTRANAAAGVFTVDYETANGTATAGSDYVATSGTLSFADNQVSATVTVTINDDGTPELDETLLLNLSDPSGAHHRRRPGRRHDRQRRRPADPGRRSTTSRSSRATAAPRTWSSRSPAPAAPAPSTSTSRPSTAPPSRPSATRAGTMSRPAARSISSPARTARRSPSRSSATPFPSRTESFRSS